MSSNRERKKRLKEQNRLAHSNNGAAASLQPQLEDRASNDSSSIIRHGAGKIETFELKESELQQLENYTWGGRFFDFGITGVSVAATIITSMVADNNMNATVKGVFLLTMIVCIIGGIVCFYLAYERSKERKEFFKRIRERV